MIFARILDANKWEVARFHDEFTALQMCHLWNGDPYPDHRWRLPFSYEVFDTETPDFAEEIANTIQAECRCFARPAEGHTVCMHGNNLAAWPQNFEGKYLGIDTLPDLEEKFIGIDT